jgi:molybdopterin converting factor subunit 1
MKITILFFGAAYDLAGVRQMPMELTEGMDTESLRTILAERFSGINSNMRYALAVNERHCTQPTMLKEGDVVAVLPPVSGG